MLKIVFFNAFQMDFNIFDAFDDQRLESRRKQNV